MVLELQFDPILIHSSYHYYLNWRQGSKNRILGAERRSPEQHASRRGRQSSHRTLSPRQAQPPQPQAGARPLCGSTQIGPTGVPTEIQVCQGLVGAEHVHAWTSRVALFPSVTSVREDNCQLKLYTDNMQSSRSLLDPWHGIQDVGSQMWPPRS